MQLGENDAYLYALAQISTAFVGFSALIALLREALGDGVSRLEAWVTRVFVQLGFTVTASALTPVVLIMCGAPPLLVWRAASGVVGTFVLIFSATYPWRRFAVSGRRAPLFVYADLVLLASTSVFLLYVAAASVRLPAAWYAAGITAVFLVSGLGYIHALGGAEKRPVMGRRRQ